MARFKIDNEKDGIIFIQPGEMGSITASIQEVFPAGTLPVSSSGSEFPGSRHSPIFSENEDLTKPDLAGGRTTTLTVEGDGTTIYRQDVHAVVEPSGRMETGPGGGGGLLVENTSSVNPLRVDVSMVRIDEASALGTTVLDMTLHTEELPVAQGDSLSSSFVSVRASPFSTPPVPLSEGEEVFWPVEPTFGAALPPTPTPVHEAAPADRNAAASAPSGNEGAINEATGEINWDCPCLAEAVAPPCGDYFKAAFSCFVKSATEPKGEDCIDAFMAMHQCYQAHPDVYQPKEDREEHALN